jgi:hypothetical protein
MPHLRLNGKGQHERIVYLSATATQQLEKYLQSRPSDSGERVFLNRKGKPITATGIQLQLAKKSPLNFPLFCPLPFDDKQLASFFRWYYEEFGGENPMKRVPAPQTGCLCIVD